MTLPKKYDEALDQAAVKYTNKTALRATIQLIPYVGGSLDTLFSETGSKIRQERLDNYLNILDRRLSKIESAQPLDPDETFFDLMMAAFDGVLRARSEVKRRCFANIIAHQVQFRKEWDDAETAVRLLSDLTEQHIALLMEMLNAPQCKEPFEGLRVVTLHEVPRSDDICFKNIGASFSNIPETTLRILISELISRGMVRDEGFNRIETELREYFLATDLAEWLLIWINE